MPLARVSLLALVALLLSACATTGPRVSSADFSPTIPLRASG